MRVIKSTISIIKKEQDSAIYCLQEIQFEYKYTDGLKVEKKIYHANTKQKSPKQNPDVAVLTLDQVDFRMKDITGDKEGHFMIIKGQSLFIKKTYNPKFVCI